MVCVGTAPLRNMSKVHLVRAAHGEDALKTTTSYCSPASRTFRIRPAVPLCCVHGVRADARSLRLVSSRVCSSAHYRRFHQCSVRIVSRCGVVLDRRALEFGRVDVGQGEEAAENLSRLRSRLADPRGC